MRNRKRLEKKMENSKTVFGTMKWNLGFLHKEIDKEIEKDPENVDSLNFFNRVIEGNLNLIKCYEEFDSSFEYKEVI